MTFSRNEALKKDLHRLEHWAIVNVVKFNEIRCWILHLGWSNTGHKYKLGEDWLENSPADRDPGVLASRHSKLSSSVFCSQEGKPHPTQGHPTQHHHPGRRDGCPPVFSIGSGPHNNVKVLEYVQIRATKLVTGLGGMSYVKQLRTLSFSSLGKGG